jgi:uncharacterized SAM-binding protein YcdF (DUF218 family)
MMLDAYPTLKKLIYLIVFMPVCWAVGLFIFINYIPEHESGENIRPTDAVIILTGGSMRLEEGIDIFNRVGAKKLLISGVAPGVSKAQIFAILTKANRSLNIDPNDIILGNLAYSTSTNASEAKIFMRLNNFNSMILVTSNYHIIRSMKIFQYHMPEIKILPYAVCSEKFRKIGNFISYPSLLLAMQEYNKLLFFYVVKLDQGVTKLYLDFLDLIYSSIRPILFETDRSQPE